MRAPRHAVIAVMALTASTHPRPRSCAGGHRNPAGFRRSLKSARGATYWVKRATCRIQSSQKAREHSDPATGAEFHNWVRCATGGPR